MGHDALPAVTKHLASRNSTSMQCNQRPKKGGWEHTDTDTHNGCNSTLVIRTVIAHTEVWNDASASQPARPKARAVQPSNTLLSNQSPTQQLSVSSSASLCCARDVQQLGLVRVKGHCRACPTSRHSIQCLGHATSCVALRRQPSAQQGCPQLAASTKHERRGHRKHWQQPKGEVGNTCTCARSNPPRPSLVRQPHGQRPVGGMEASHHGRPPCVSQAAAAAATGDQQWAAAEELRCVQARGLLCRTRDFCLSAICIKTHGTTMQVEAERQPPQPAGTCVSACGVVVSCISSFLARAREPKSRA